MKQPLSKTTFLQNLWQPKGFLFSGLSLIIIGFSYTITVIFEKNNNLNNIIYNQLSSKLWQVQEFQKEGNLLHSVYLNHHYNLVTNQPPEIIFASSDRLGQQINNFNSRIIILDSQGFFEQALFQDVTKKAKIEKPFRLSIQSFDVLKQHLDGLNNLGAIASSHEIIEQELDKIQRNSYEMSLAYYTLLRQDYVESERQQQPDLILFIFFLSLMFVGLFLFSWVLWMTIQERDLLYSQLHGLPRKKQK